MTEIKREVLEKHYIRDHFDHKFPDRINPLGDTPKEYRELTKYEYNKEHETRHRKFYGKEPNRSQETVYYYGWGSVMSDLCCRVSNLTAALIEKRKNANAALKDYLYYKELLKNGSLKWSDPLVRENLYKRKKQWIKASNSVIGAKAYLQQGSLIYNRFVEWYKATNDRISYLENELNDIKTKHYDTLRRIYED